MTRRCGGDVSDHVPDFRLLLPVPGTSLASAFSPIAPPGKLDIKRILADLAGCETGRAYESCWLARRIVAGRSCRSCIAFASARCELAAVRHGGWETAH